MLQTTMEELLQNFHEQIFDPARLPTAMLAIVIVMIGGMFRGALGGMATPFYWHLVDLSFGGLGDRMNKKGRLRGDLIFRGFILCVLVLCISFLIGRFLSVLAVHYPNWSVVEILSLCILLVSGSVFATLGQLYRALNEKKVTPGAYYSIARSTRTNLSNSDDFSITRIGMGLALKSFDKGIVAPIFWYLIAGIQGGFIYAGLAVLSWRFGKEGHSGGFGETAIALEKLMGFIPNLLSGVFIALAGLLTPTAGMTRAFLGFISLKGRASYPEGGAPMTTAAHSLNVSLGGPRQDLDGSTIKSNWIGPAKATAQLNAKHLHRVVYISFMAHLLFLASLSGAMLFAKSELNFDFLPF